MSGTITTPPSASFSTSALSDNEKADIRRFCGYPPVGTPAAGGFQSWRFFTKFGVAEYRMNNMAPAEFQNLRYYLAKLYTLESDVWSASANLDTSKAAVWTHNENEVRDRVALLRLTRIGLCSLLGVTPGPDLAQSGLSIII